MSKICLIYFLTNFFLIEAGRRRCVNSGVLFPDKISRSPIVVFGESIEKRVYFDNDAELLFNVTFRVDCIFKGEIVPNRILITGAGVQNGRSSCQFLEPGHSYVVFVEKWAEQYRPFDFQERFVDSMTFELLEKTCHLKRLPPMNSTTDKCPNVSSIDACPHDSIDVNLDSKERLSFGIKSSTFNDEQKVSDATNSNKDSSIGQSSQAGSLFNQKFVSFLLLVSVINAKYFSLRQM